MLKKNYKVICNVVCAVLMLALLVLQFLPNYWTCQNDRPDKDGNYKTDSASLQGYMWMPTEHKLLGNHFEDLYGKNFELNQVVLMPVVTLAFSAIGAVLALVNRRTKVTGKLGILVGAVGAYGYLSHPIFRMNALWIVHLVVCVVMALVGLTSAVVSIVSKRSATKKKAHAAA